MDASLSLSKLINKNFYKDLAKKMKRQTTDWENVFANHISNKGLGSRITKQLSKLNRKKNSEYGEKTQTFH